MYGSYFSLPGNKDLVGSAYKNTLGHEVNQLCIADEQQLVKRATWFPFVLETISNIYEDCKKTMNSGTAGSRR